MGLRSPFLIIFFTATLSMCVACVQPARLPQPDPSQSRESLQFSEVDGVRVAIQPYTSRDALEKYFGVDLLEISVVPIMVFIENSSDRAILIEAGKFRIVPDVHGENTSVQTGNQMAKPFEVSRTTSTRDTGLVTSAGALTGIPIVVAPIVFMAPFLDYSNRKMVEVSSNIGRQAITDTTLYKHEKHHGFIYLRISDDMAATQDLALSIPLGTVDLKSSSSLRLPLRLPKEDLSRRIPTGGKK